jgi:hypothetical protein
MLYAFFWVIPRILNFICRRFVTLCSIVIRTYLPMKMEQTECSETLAYKIQTPGNYQEENKQHTVLFETRKATKCSKNLCKIECIILKCTLEKCSATNIKQTHLVQNERQMLIFAETVMELQQQNAIRRTKCFSWRSALQSASLSVISTALARTKEQSVWNITQITGHSSVRALRRRGGGGGSHKKKKEQRKKAGV